MAQSNLNGGLELLDRGDADVITLVEHAARILHVDLHQSEPGSTQSSKPNALASNYGFREQWVLRWLIRKVASELQAVGRRDHPATAQSFLLDLRLWKILLHVLRSTPDHVCAEIIAERKLSQCLDQVVQYVLLHLDAESQNIAQQETSIFSRCDEEGHQVKRQRLSPDVCPTLRNEQEHSGLAVWILAVCCRVAAAIKPPPDTQKDAVSTEIAPWTLTTRDNASMLGTALHLLLALLRQRPQNPVSFDLNASATQLLSFWQSRLITASESAKTEEVSVFAVHCLRPCLELITQLQERKSGPKYRETQANLEKLVALNVVLPLRKRFFERHAKSWKSQGDHLTWMEIRKVYNDFMNIIEPSHSATLRETKMLQVKWAAFTPAIYSIALRLLLKAELQKKQNEQPWLDALLAFLSYAACPLLAKLTLSAKKSVEVLDLAYSSDLHDSVVAIQSFLETANDLNSRPSLPVLGYLTCAILSWTSDGALWNLLAQLVKLDADVLVSNSGLPTSGFALNAFLENVETAAITLINYHVLRDQIMIPLLKGYARSRALRSFVDVWLRYLQEALRRSCVGLPKTEKVIAVLVWQDEDMFDELIGMVKRHGTAALAQSSLSRLHESLKEITGRAGSTLDVFAEIACTASIMEAMAMDSNQQVNELYGIQEFVISALNKRTDYQGQRWRLWKLLRVLQQKAPRDDIFQHIMSLEDPLVISLSRISEFIKEAQVDNISVAVYRECLERFSLIAAAAKTGKEPWVEEFKREIDGLQAIMTSDQAVLTTRPQKVWNGRLEDLDGPLKLAWACLCVALTHPTLLKMTPDFVLTARRMAGAIVEDPARARKMEKAIEEVQDMNGAQASDVESWMSIEGSGLVTASGLARLREDVASGRLKRSRLRALGDKMFAVLNEYAGEMAMESLVNLLAAMDHLSSFAMVSFTRAHSWAEWLQFLELLETSKMQKASRMHLNAVQSLKRILARAWAHYHENVSERQDAGDPKLQMLEQMASASFDHPLSKLLALQVVLSSTESSNSADGTNAQGSSNLQQIERKYLADLCQSFAQLTRPQVRVTEPWLVQVLLTLEGVFVLRNLSAASPPGSDLQSYVASLDALLEATKCDDALFDLLRTAQGQCARLGAALGVEEGSLAREQRLQSVDLSTGDITNREIRTLAAKAQLVVNSLDTDSCVRLMTLMSQPLGTKIGLLRSFLVAAVVLHVDSSMLSTSAELTEYLDKIASLTSAEELGSSTQLALCVENGKLVLDRHSGFVNQATIDTLLSEICQLLSSSQRQHDHAESYLSSKAIFNRICGLLGSIMSRFRRRLSDRHHLLLPVLQGLLRCLFFPGTAAARSQQSSSGNYAASFLHTLPFWVRNSEQPLPASAATKFSRLLSSICNPTVSAAKSSRKRHHNELHDETKRVKALAGQHMQYLVMEYARCSLDGVIEAEVKEKLMPGMYTVLDAMSRDVMRGMNAAMDASSRAIFKGLYDDWTRYGKWDKS